MAFFVFINAMAISRILHINNILLVFMIASFNVALSQNNTARLVTIIGSQVSFNFNSISKHSSGITKPNYTRFGVELADTVTGGSGITGWKIEVTPAAGFASFIGNGANTLNTNILEIKAEDANANLGASSVFNGYQILVNGTPLMTSTLLPANPNSHQIDISYRCGVTNSVFDQTPDFYEMEIEFILSPVQ